MDETIKNVIGPGSKIPGNCILGDKNEDNNPAVGKNPVDRNKNKYKKGDCSSGPSNSLRAERKNIVGGSSWIPGNLILGDENTKNAPSVESKNTVNEQRGLRVSGPTCKVGCEFKTGDKNVIGCRSEISGNVICGDNNSGNTPVVKDKNTVNKDIIEINDAMQNVVVERRSGDKEKQRRQRPPKQSPAVERSSSSSNQKKRRPQQTQQTQQPQHKKAATTEAKSALTTTKM